MRRVSRLVLVVGLLVSLTGCASTLVALGIGAERGRANLRELVSTDGIVYLERDPREPAATLVLLHGFAGNKDHWTRFCQQLPDNVRVVVPDLPGFGESPKKETESYDTTSQVERLDRFVKERGLEKFHLMGNSMGGAIATAYALTHPEKVETLVLFDPAGIKGPVPARMDVLTEGGKHPLIIKSVEDFDTLMALSFVTPPHLPDLVKGYFAEQAARNGTFSEKVFADIKARPRPLLDDIDDLKPPTLVIWGDSDGIIDPSAVPLWRERVPGHLVVVMAQTGHAPMVERPAESAALVLTWWKNLAAEGRAFTPSATSAPPPAP